MLRKKSGRVHPLQSNQPTSKKQVEGFDKEANMSTKFRWSIITILVVLTSGLLLAGQTYPASQTSPAQGQPAMGATASSAETHLQMLTEKLNLTEGQRAKLKPILQEQEQQLKAVRDNTSLSPEEKHARKKAIHESFHEKINGVLTPEQQAKLKEMKQQDAMEKQHQ
jgi:periplasmic protein CpxP/Spy